MTKITDNYGFEQRQLSRQQLANLLQLSTSQLKEIINRNSNTTLNVLVKISAVTGEKIEI